MRNQEELESTDQRKTQLRLEKIDSMEILQMVKRDNKSRYGDFNSRLLKVGFLFPFYPWGMGTGDFTCKKP